MVRFSANSPPHRRAAPTRAAAALLSGAKTTAAGFLLAPLAYAVAGAAAGVALGLASQVAEPLLSAARPSGLLARARALARQVDASFVDQASERLADYITDFLGLPADSHHQLMQEREFFEHELRGVQRAQRTAGLIWSILPVCRERWRRWRVT